MIALRQRLELYGLPLATAAIGVIETVLGVLSVPIGAAIAVSGAILVAALDIRGRMRTVEASREAEQRALARLAEAAVRLQRGRRSPTLDLHPLPLRRQGARAAERRLSAFTGDR